MDWLDNPIAVLALLWFVFTAISRIFQKKKAEQAGEEQRGEQPGRSEGPAWEAEAPQERSEPERAPGDEIPPAVRRWLESMGFELPPEREPPPPVAHEAPREQHAGAEARRPEPWRETVATHERETETFGEAVHDWQTAEEVPEEPWARPEEPWARPEEPWARPEKPWARPEEPWARPEERAEVVEEALGVVDRADLEHVARWVPPKRERPRVERLMPIEEQWQRETQARRGALLGADPVAVVRDAIILDSILAPRRFPPGPRRR